MLENEVFHQSPVNSYLLVGFVIMLKHRVSKMNWKLLHIWLREATATFWAIKFTVELQILGNFRNSFEINFSSIAWTPFHLLEFCSNARASNVNAHWDRNGRKRCPARHPVVKIVCLFFILGWNLLFIRNDNRNDLYHTELSNRTFRSDWQSFYIL